ncbi:MAG: trimethylamine methyltransferase family protein [Candidatus Methylomirabilales bacterium]
MIAHGIPLSGADASKIHAASLEILAQVGVKITHAETRGLLLDAGAREGEPSILRLPPELVQRALALAPRTVRFASLGGQVVEVACGGAPLFWSGNAMFYQREGRRQELSRETYVEFCRVAHQLPHLHAIVGTSLGDYPPATRDFVGFRAMAEHTRKHLRPVIFTPRGIEAILEMAEVLLEGRSLREHPILSLGFTIVSPLQWSGSALEVFRVSSGHGIPLMVNSEVIAGATGPVTLAGTLALANAEALSGIVIAELLEPGRPVVFNLGFSHTFDMAFAETLTGAPEGALLGAGGAALGRLHGLPTASWMSTESKLADAQAAHEKTLLGTLHALGGVNLIWGIGNLESTLALCPEQAVIDNEIAAAILRTWRGIRVDDERLALPTVAELAHAADYLGSAHTHRFFREELMDSRLMNRERHGFWAAAGGKGLTQRAAERVRELLRLPAAEHLGGAQRDALARIEKRWLERLA